MKTLPIPSALRKLAVLKSRFRKAVAEGFEHKAKDCLTCEQQGICCTDTHFVNVHITRLEAEAIRERLLLLPARQQLEVIKRAEIAVTKYGLEETEDSFGKTYSCPLFEPGTGCLVHGDTKPLPCIHHACYESPEDLPPQELLEENERQVERINARTFGNAWNWQPIPVWLRDMDES
jgi:hypothetical protein